MRKRRLLRKKIGELDDSFWFLDRMRYWFVDRKRSSPLSFPLLLAVHCTCSGKKEVKRAQDSHAFQTGALEERFKRSETLRVSLPFLSKSLKKALLYRCEKAKVHTCMATESKQIPGLVMAKLDFPLLVVSSCFRRFYGGPACIRRVASNGRFFFERLQRANGSRVDLLVDRCIRNSLHAQFVQTLKHETVNYYNKQSPTVPYPKCSLRYALRGWEKKFHTHAAQRSVAKSPPRALRALSGDLATSASGWGMKL